MKRNLFVHVLRMAGIHYCNRVAIDGVGVIPFISIGHVIVSPSANSRLAAWQSSLNGIDIKNGFANVALHVFKRIGVMVLQGNVSIKSPDVPNGLSCVAILIWHPSCRKQT